MNIQLTDNAIKKINELANEEEETVYLRVFIEGGGCSGMQYGFTFDTEIGSSDWSIEAGDTQLLIDATSGQYLDGAEIDYVEELRGAQFVIKNPNAQTSCGCGSSFAPG
jgi:iron-sulfur cluster insertion protein